jgi:hypothetical protein
MDQRSTSVSPSVAKKINAITKRYQIGQVKPIHRKKKEFKESEQEFLFDVLRRAF